jgi:hypothetical protein
MLLNKLKTSFALVAAAIIFFTNTGCKKEADPIDTTAFFNANVLNQDLKVHLATDNGITITNNYSAYTFKCTTGGVFTASNSLFSINGTWTANADYSKVTFTLPTPPSDFIFLNREWTFTNYSTPIMELGYSATAGGEYKILHFQKQ